MTAGCFFSVFIVGKLAEGMMESAFTRAKSHEIDLLGRFSPLPGTIAHTCHVFVARKLQLGARDLDEHEVIDVVLKPWQEVVDMVLSAEAVDGSLVNAVLRYLART